MDAKYNVTVYVNNGEGRTDIMKGTAEFCCNPEDYGNGYGMYIEGLGEAFGGQAYDIRYDTDFHKDNMLLYIVQFFSKRFTGKNGSWKLIGIRVHEAD